MRILNFIVRFCDWINEIVGRTVSWLTLLMVLVVCYDVFTRYVLKSSMVAVQELEWHLFAILFLIAAGYTLKHDKHVRVDVIYAHLSHKKQAIIDLLGTILFLIPFSILIIKTAIPFIQYSFCVNETSPDPGGLPCRYLLKSCIVVGFSLVLLQGISMFFKKLFCIFNISEKGD